MVLKRKQHQRIQAQKNKDKENNHKGISMNYVVTKNNKMLTYILMGVGILSIVYGFATDSLRAWGSLLVGNFYVMAIALAGTFFLAVQYVAEVGWSVQIKRIMMAMGGYLPFAGAFLILIFLFGKHDLYFWTHSEYYDKASPEYDEILAGKHAFLNVPFYVIRLLLYAGLWSWFAFRLRKESLEEDINGGVGNYKKSVGLSATFLVIFAVSSSTSAWDILMSVDAHWFSTLFGWYIFAGMFVSGLTVMAMLAVYLKKNGYLPNVNEHHIHDMGKFMFAFSIFWTYLWFAQFMLIWYANLPEEVIYYGFRQDHFPVIFIVNFLINFFFPFFILMTRDSKRIAGLITFVGCIMLAGHWLDVFLIVMPGVVGETAKIGITEVGTTCFFAGLFLYVVFDRLSKAAVVPKNHPMLGESLHHNI
jgi:hypothetical protein